MATSLIDQEEILGRISSDLIEHFNDFEATANVLSHYDHDTLLDLLAAAAFNQGGAYGREECGTAGYGDLVTVSIAIKGELARRYRAAVDGIEE